MNESYIAEGMWTIPLKGTFGKKAENLFKNTDTILKCGWNVPHSMIIPYEYYNREGGIFYMLDDISEHFRDCEFVAVRSSSPDEDLGERTPGLYRSEKIKHQDRKKALNQLEKVLSSYYRPQAVQRREKNSLEYKGMSLLVQEWIPAAFSGSFSDIGETAVLVFTDPTKGIESMLKPSKMKFFVDLNGKITMNSHYITTYDQEWAMGLRNITNNLPSLKEKGWELEFVINERGKYILQTTPIKKQLRFEVQETENNIFYNKEVIGTGIFRTKGILYLPTTDEFDMNLFDASNKNYCLVTNYVMTSSKSSEMGLNPLTKANNAKAFFCVSPEGRFQGLNSFAAHVEAFVRDGGCCALAGRFTNEFKDTMSGQIGDIPAFLHTNLLIQADEIEQKANVEII